MGSGSDSGVAKLLRASVSSTRKWGESELPCWGGGVLALHSRRSVEAISLLPLCSKSFHGHMVTSTLPWEVPRSEQGP